MLSTGIKTPVGIKITGPDLNVLQSLGEKIEAVLKKVPGTRSVFAERAEGGNYIDFDIDRDAIARYGLTVGNVEDIFQSAIGGMNITKTIEGLQRYPVNLRYQRDYRNNLEALKRVLVPLPGGGQIPLGQLGAIIVKKGPPVIKSEDARPESLVYVDLNTTDIGSYVAAAKKVVDKEIHLPQGYSLVWSGQYEYMERAAKTLSLVIPLTLLLVVLLLYFNTKSFVKTGIILLALPFSMVGAVWYLYFAGFHMSVAVWVGIIALLGVSAEMGVVMLLYLDVAYDNMKNQGLLTSLDRLKEAIFQGAVRRIRPVVMTVTVLLIGLLPILIGHGVGSDVMKRIVAPMFGGIITAMLIQLAFYPAIFFIVKKREMKKQHLIVKED
jgi:Cu(I)/Ag(I) efflux system membrane protein CusA/SilA